MNLESLLHEAEIAHGHLCAGQVLGVRMAIYACHLLGIEEPRGKDRKRLVTFVEIDRCATDAIGVVTGCRLGKRALKFVDFGKMAATFVDLRQSSGDDIYGGIRIAALETSRDLAKQRYPEMADKNQQQMRAYRELADDELFSMQRIEVTLPANEFPGFKGGRIACEQCGRRYQLQTAKSPLRAARSVVPAQMLRPATIAWCEANYKGRSVAAPA